MSEWLKGFISGVIATVIGFILTMLWDIFKSRGETEERENKVLLAVKEDLESNLRILNDNFDLIRQELEIIESNRSVINPLVPLKTGFWDLVKIHLPKRLMKGDLLIKIRDVVKYTEQINEAIQSRENFRIHNRALTSFGVQLKSYDQILVDNIKKILDLMKELSPSLELFKKK